MEGGVTGFILKTCQTRVFVEQLLCPHRISRAHCFMDSHGMAFPDSAGTDICHMTLPPTITNLKL